MSSIRVYVDLDDVYDGMDRNDKMRMAEWLYEQHKKKLHNLWEKYYIMSDEDLKLIEEISKKY
jgi:hypothetical protein